MAAFTKRKGRYLARVRKDGFKTVCKTFTLLKDAKAWARRVEADMEAGRYVEAGEAGEAGTSQEVRQQVPTLREALALYEKTVACHFKGAHDYTYRYREMAGEPFASKPVDELTTRDLSAWRDRQLLRWKPGTVIRKLALLSACLVWCMKDRGWILSNPLSLVRRPRSSPGRERVLSPEEHAALMAAARAYRAAWFAPALTVLLRSAMRRGELFGMNADDVDFRASTARLRDTKNGLARTVPLCPVALAAVRELAEAAAARGEGALLPIGHVGSFSTAFKYTVRRAQRMHAAACAAAGKPVPPGFLADVRLHDARHWAVSAWAATGSLSVMELMQVSGHQSPRMLARYTHLSASALAAKLAGLTPTV